MWKMTIDENLSGMERAKCAEIAANIAIDILKMESEMIYLAAKNIQGKDILNKLHSSHQSKNGY
jgi:hypothetical protein